MKDNECLVAGGRSFGQAALKPSTASIICLLVPFTVLIKNLAATAEQYMDDAPGMKLENSTLFFKIIQLDGMKFRFNPIINAIISAGFKSDFKKVIYTFFVPKLKLNFGITSDCSGKEWIHHFFEITFETGLKTSQFHLL